MRDKKHQRRHDNVRGFDVHSGRKMPRHGSGELRKGRAWRFFDSAHVRLDPFEPHYRVTSRMSALPGKHMRSVEEPVRAAHGRIS